MKKRIEAIAQYIPPYKYIADIGCDHGYLILEAFNKYNIVHAQAIDNKIKPLQSAQNNLQKYKDNITFILGDGLCDLEENIEVVILAGMGGILIINILQNNIIKLKNIKRIIIQANRDIDKVREFAYHNGYKIVSEKIINERSIFYEIIVLEKGFAKYSAADIMFGPCLLKEKNDIFIRKWKNEYEHLKKIQSEYAKIRVKIINDYLNLEEENENKRCN